jgi:hypothetical protein
VTAATPEAPKRIPLRDLLIVDTDVHVHESPGALAPYCDMPWRVALENVADVPERYLDIPGFSPGGDGTLTARFPSSHEATRMVHSPDQMVSELKEIEVDLAPASTRSGATAATTRSSRPPRPPGCRCCCTP